MSQILFNDSCGSPDGYVQMCARDDDIELRFPPRYFVHLGQPDPDHGPNSWSANKPTMVSLIGQASDDHVLNE